MNEMIEIKHKNFEATILKQGAQLIHFQPLGEEKLLWHTDLNYFAEGKAFRGGVPVCWPWFGKAQFPVHGFARIMEWELASRVDEEDDVVLEWKLNDSAKTRAIWDHPFEIRLKMVLGRSLQMELSVDTDTQTTGALHSYFYVNDLDEVKVGGLGEKYLDALDGHALHVSSEPSLTIESEVDRVYVSASDMTTLQENKRTVEIHHQNFSDVVVWNPYKDLPDMEEGSYKKMLCIETARIAKPFEKKDFMGFTCKVI
ncbi:D-hexose-6-phosphate mutarotase [bacterium]|nr:D-hexose-6-phosphate mutarotase [bacterium]MBU1884317.1 D-hexose-6-phosphate mutarotase [bacterium]